MAKMNHLLSYQHEKEILLNRQDLLGLVTSASQKGVPISFCAKGFSMSPFVRDGDIVTVSPLRDSLPKIGDVVAFHCTLTDRLVVHRVICKKGNSYHMQGDSVPMPDGIVPIDNIIGLVTKLERNGEKVSIGLGPERFLIAFLNRTGVLSNILRPVWTVMRSFIKN